MNLQGAQYGESVSIRAPRVGGDLQMTQAPPPMSSFNPRPPCGGRRAAAADTLTAVAVSIRAPRVGGDNMISGWTGAVFGFNPRPPCGGRQHDQRVDGGGIRFQSAPPVWGATT